MLICAGSCGQMRGSRAVWRLMSFSYSCSTSSVLNPNMILINWCEFLNFNHKNKWSEWRVVSGGSAETSFLSHFLQFDVSRVQSERFHLLWLFNKSSDSSVRRTQCFICDSTTTPVVFYHSGRLTFWNKLINFHLKHWTHSDSIRWVNMERMLSCSIRTKPSFQHLLFKTVIVCKRVGPADVPAAAPSGQTSPPGTSGCCCV